MTKRHVLVAEDEAHARLSLSVILRKADYRVTTVESGVQALDAIVNALGTEQAVDLLVTDLQMDGLTGPELIEALTQREIKLPMLVLTGYGDRDTMEALKANGCFTCVEKPLEPGDVLKSIDEAFADWAKREDPGQQAIGNKRLSVAPTKVLVVDDDEAIVRLIVKALSRVPMNFKVDGTTSAFEALMRIGKEGPGLVCLDVNMPGLDGREVLRAIRNDTVGGAMKVLVVSGYPDDGEDMRRLGADDVLLKPFTVTELTKRVGRLLSGATGDRFEEKNLN